MFIENTCWCGFDPVGVACMLPEIFYKHANPPDLYNANSLRLLPDSLKYRKRRFLPAFSVKKMLTQKQNVVLTGLQGFMLWLFYPHFVTT